MSNARFSILQARAISDKRISDAQFRTLAALGMYADKNGWCFPSLFRIGLDCGKSKQAAGRDVIALKKLGYVETYPQFDERGGRRVNKYRLIFDAPVNVDDSTPSTPDVDTPSTPDVDVNVPINDTKKTTLSKELQEQADRKVDAILAQSIKPEGYWQGRENIPPHLLNYADWWNRKTGQEMKGKVKADYLKEWTAWNNEELPLTALDEAFEYVNGWKSRQGGRVAHPREITKDAVGYAANPKQEETKPITGGFYG